MGNQGGNAAAVVVAEDNFLTSHLIVATLSKAGYHAEVGRDGDTVTRLVRELRPRVLIINLNLSRPSGMELLRTLRPQESGMRVVAFLAPGQADMRPQAVTLGADAFFEPPFEPDELIREVGRLIGE
jgi:DNA-binding response OmpR family regulator